jgi:hypothetical protein
MMRLSHDSNESLFFEAIEVYATCLLGISFLVELNPWSSKEPRLAPTWRTNCQMVRSGQPIGVLIPVAYLFGGEESKAKNSKVAHEYAEHRKHGEFILVRTSGE